MDNWGHQFGREFDCSCLSSSCSVGRKIFFGFLVTIPLGGRTRGISDCYWPHNRDLYRAP